MNCAELRRALPALSADSAPPQLRAQAVGHAAQCPGCALLLSVARGERDAGGTPVPADLLPSVLEATGGSPCGTIGERLVLYADGELRGLDASLVEAHLERCAACREVVAALPVLREELPRLAEAETDIRFVVDVLEKTSWIPRKPGSASAAARRAWSDLQDLASRLVRRPRAALELAYGAGLCLYLAAGWPHDAVRDLSTRPAGWLERGIASRAEALLELRQPLEDASVQLRAIASRPREELAALPSRGTAERVVETTGKVLRTAELVWRGLREMGRSLIRGDLGAIWRALAAMRSEVRRCWLPPPDRPESRTEPSPDRLRSPG